jgi:putative peptide zinc metalloprotease protein
MNTPAIPRLRDEAVVCPFDDGGARQRFVVAIDGNHFVVTPTIAAVLDETRRLGTQAGAFESLAQRVSQRVGAVITPAQIELLLREKLPKTFFEPLPGPVEADGPLMLRRLLLSGPRLRPLLASAAHLFGVAQALALSALFLILDLFVAQQVLAHGAGELAGMDYASVLALTLAGIFFHELGHLAACHRFGGEHGGIGIGLYWCVPAFYAEVHGAWTLPRRQRAAVDASGVYFQCVYVSVLAVIYLASPHPALLSAIVWSQFLMLHTLNPVLKFDGYWLLSDLAGIHNLHRQVRDTARGILRGIRPGGAQLHLLGAFSIVAFAYFAYLLTLLGHNLGLSAASFAASFLTDDLSTSALLAAFGKGCLLAVMFAMAVGVAVLLARSAAAVLKESSNEP